MQISVCAKSCVGGRKINERLCLRFFGKIIVEYNELLWMYRSMPCASSCLRSETFQEYPWRILVTFAFFFFRCLLIYTSETILFCTIVQIFQQVSFNLWNNISLYYTLQNQMSIWHRDFKMTFIQSSALKLKFFIKIYDLLNCIKIISFYHK